MSQGKVENALALCAQQHRLCSAISVSHALTGVSSLDLGRGDAALLFALFGGFAQRGARIVHQRHQRLGKHAEVGRQALEAAMRLESLLVHV